MTYCGRILIRYISFILAWLVLLAVVSCRSTKITQHEETLDIKHLTEFSISAQDTFRYFPSGFSSSWLKRNNADSRNIAENFGNLSTNFEKGGFAAEDVPMVTRSLKITASRCDSTQAKATSEQREQRYHGDERKGNANKCWFLVVSLFFICVILTFQRKRS